MSHEESEERIEPEFRLPVPVEPRQPRPSLARSSPAAAFLSQLIAARSRLEPQKEMRRAPVDIALDAYSTGAKITVRRMPKGYRKTLVI
ncbi:hypothetical protein VE25_14485 [Devosia geojensis]|uniref:Uncharacterized protein n=1 Tax=Devosia geojensis TaxID=443610 RepID=A0A0F5FS42_9HYPH|nr:hypothetical protein [Devosia geojensis]KKB10997.1 hypothetical protein VE25_14485 [Devosia geojensis]